MRYLLIISAIIFVVAFIYVHRDNFNPKNKSGSKFGVSDAAFGLVGAVVVIVGLLIFLWVLNFFMPGPEDLPSPQDYGP